MLVYFAHPCFNPAQAQFKSEFLGKLSRVLADRGSASDVSILDPFAHTPNVEHDLETKLAMSESIKTACIQLLEGCDAVMALVDGEDTGTAFEAGYACCMNMPILLISEGSCDGANAMLIGAAKERFDNILDDGQMEKLVRTLEWFSVSKKHLPPSPGSN